MTEERRYSDVEVAEIFRRASEVQQGTRAPLASRDGMTLSAIQDIGRDVGLPPELIATAARALDARPREETRRFLGLPLGVSRTVQLERRLTDAEWEALVVDLRDTFDARGNLRQDGAFRQWTNGNLQALLEPTEQGDRLRLKTLHGAARGYLMGGLALLAMGVVFTAAAILGGAPARQSLSVNLPLTLIGTGLIAAGALRLPSWARTRREQMAAVSEKVIGNR